MTSPLPPDPYKTLGVVKDAKLAEIRSAHRKLVLKCHPDKVQDATLKAAKQDEFQKVQQAYELLSDETRRIQYDEQVKLFELRKEMGRGIPTARSNPFEYEVRTAEPRTPSTAYTRPIPKPAPKVYTHQPPRSYEDVVYEEPLRGVPRKSTSYESTDRKRGSTRDDDRERERRRHEDDERVAKWWEKEKRRESHGEKKKSRDKEKKRATEEKHSRTTAPYIEDDSEEDVRAPPRTSSHKKSSRQMEEETRQRKEEAVKAARAAEKMDTLLPPKWDAHRDFAGQYMQASKQKVKREEEFHPGPMRRAETFAGAVPAYDIRYATPTKAREEYSDEDLPKRSSAHKKETRRSSETPPTRSRDVKSSSKESRRSPGGHTRDPYIVEPPGPSPPPTVKKVPNLNSFSSAPPNLAPSFATRKEPSRSKTQEYPRSTKEPIPSLPRAHTFQDGARDRGRDRTGGSRLRNPVEYTSTDSDSDSPTPRHTSPRYSHSPPPTQRSRPAPEPTRYIIDNGRSHPISSRSTHRADLRGVDPDVDYTRERSESPRGGGRHSSDRPPLARNESSGRGSSRQIPARSQSHQTYYAPNAPDPPTAPVASPIIMNARPKLHREGSGGHKSSRGGGNGAGGYFEEVKYGEIKFAPAYGHEHVIYATSPNPDAYRRGSDPRHDAYPSTRGRSGEVFVS